MRDLAQVINSVPVGVDKAMSARAIWKMANVWGESSFQNKLNALVDLGQVQRRKHLFEGDRFRYVYWREAAA